jgi:heme-degrading monooxygenase HmoA
MTYTEIRLNVGDYAKWREGFDASAGFRRSYGATGNDQVYRDRENPNTVTAIVEWADAKRAREWSQTPQLKEAQQKAGVTAVLDMHILERA